MTLNNVLELTPTQLSMTYYGAWNVIENLYSWEECDRKRVKEEAYDLIAKVGDELSHRGIHTPSNDSEYRLPVYNTPPVTSFIGRLANGGKTST